MGRTYGFRSAPASDDPWGQPVNLGSIINTAANERSPGLSRDGHHLFFATTRPGGSGGFDIWVSWRHDTRDDFGWQTPVNLGAQFNSAATDAGPAYFENDDAGVPLLFLASNRPGGAGGLDIYVSELTASGSFGPPVLVNELSGAANDLTPGVRHDGLEIIIASNRAGTIGAQDLWVSTRNAVGDPWSAARESWRWLSTAPSMTTSHLCHPIERRSSSARTGQVAQEGPTFT